MKNQYIPWEHLVPDGTPTEVRQACRKAAQDALNRRAGFLLPSRETGRYAAERIIKEAILATLNAHAQTATVGFVS